MTLHRFARPAILGAGDGIGCAIGVLLSLHGHASLVLPNALAIGAAEAVSMAGSDWQSNAATGRASAVVVGAATGVGVVGPALPYVLMPGGWARVASVAVVLAVTGVIAALRVRERGPRAFAESYGILALTAAVVWASQLVGGA